MKILLVKPKIRSDTIIPPLGLGYLAGKVCHNHDVMILDCLKDSINEKDFLDFAKNYRPDLLGLQVYNVDKEVARSYIKKIKEFNKDIITVIGGPYPSCEPENVFEFFGSSLDFAFCGEAEIGFGKLVSKISKDEIKLRYEDIDGLLWLRKGVVVKNNQSFVENLDDFNPPAWNLLNPLTYPPAPVGAFLKRFPVTSINISRGCPYTCSFCAGQSITGYKVRYRSVKNVIEEIKLLHGEFGIRELHILDDNFTYDKKYVIDFCNEVLKCGVKIKFACPNGVRINSLDKELLELMKRTGFYAIHVGIESGSQKVLRYMDKKITLNLVKTKVNLIKDAGMDVCGYFIFGYPGDSLSDLNNTIKLALKLPLVRAMFMNFLPIPGTRAFNHFKKISKLSNINLTKKTFYNVNFTSGAVTKKRLKLLQIAAFLFFYMRPRIILKNLTDIYNFKHMLYLTRRIFRILISW